ncbi:hypothetical protein NQZ68_019334 [Dissostichus eleginoides]|nr:hypothetical protein NQZ68_019334 [Dissostichus eleginoides]
MEELARESISLLASASNKPRLDVATQPRLGSMGAIFIMLKSALGAGLLNFPWAFERAGGIRSAVAVELVSLVFLISGLIVLGYSSSISGQCTYQAVVKHVCGPAIGQLCEICFVINLFVISVAFLVIVDDQLEKLCGSMYELISGLPESEMPYHFYTDQHFALVLLCLLLILPLSIPKEISIQKYISVWKEEDSVRYGPQENLACSSRGNLDFYLPDLSVVAGEGFDHHAHWPLIPMDPTVLQQHKFAFLQVRCLSATKVLKVDGTIDMKLGSFLILASCLMKVAKNELEGMTPNARAALARAASALARVLTTAKLADDLLEPFDDFDAVLGTVAASYLAIAIIVKYHTTPSVIVHIAPLYTGGISSWASMFSVIPTICFGFQCHEASIAIYSSMENQRLSNWVFISVVSMIFCLIIYSLTGVYGYLTFGKDVKADILMSYSSDDVLMIIARLLFGLSIITIYPIILLLGRSVIQDPLLSRRRRRDGVVSAEFESRSRIVLTVLWIAVTLLIATFVPDISKVISVIGGVSAFFIFIFPGLCLMFAMQSEPVSFKTRVFLTGWGGVTLLCGAFIFGQSTTIAVMQVLGRI